jgi:cbb3-type cytochrome oxidase subunit 3
MGIIDMILTIVFSIVILGILFYIPYWNIKRIRGE